MKLSVAFLLILGVVAFAAMPAEAQSDSKWKIFGGAVYVSPLSDSDVTFEDVTEAVEASSEVGYELGLEWKPLNRWGFELAYNDVTHDVEVNGQKAGEVGFAPLMLTANFYVINADNITWYIGPTAAWIDWGSIDAEDGESVDTDSETTYGVSTGLDITLGERWVIYGGLRWLDSTIQAADGSGEVSVDPLIARLGVGFRF